MNDIITNGADLLNYVETLPVVPVYRNRLYALFNYILHALIFWCVCRFSIVCGATTDWSPLIWPATGFAFALLLTQGASIIPWLLVSDCLVRMTALPPVSAVPLAFCDCVGVLTAYKIFQITASDNAPFDSSGNVFSFVFAATAAGAVSSGMAATLCFAAFTKAPESALLPFFINWAVFCGAGIIIGTPACWEWYHILTNRRFCLHHSELLEFLFVSIVTVVMGCLIFLRTNGGLFSGYPLFFLFTPFFLWAALRFTSCTLFTFQFLVGSCALFGALHGMGPFETTVQQQSNLLVHTYLIVLSGTGIIVYAVLAERKKNIQTLEISKDVAIASLASLSETRDHETGAHIMRTRHYVRTLATQLQKTPFYSSQLTDTYIDMLYKAAPLHDIGKIGVPDAILLKPGKLTSEEFEEIKKHASYGRNVLRDTLEKLGSDPLIKVAEEIAYTHHEKWDGSGYPRGLKGRNIPLSGRLMALADVYDALISKRIYKKASPHHQAKEIIVKGSGTHFDPEIVNAFIRKEHEFVRISWEYADDNSN